MRSIVIVPFPSLELQSEKREMVENGRLRTELTTQNCHQKLIFGR